MSRSRSASTGLRRCSRLRRMADFFGESGVDHKHAIAAAHHPHEIVEIRPVLVRIGQDVALPGMAIA